MTNSAQLHVTKEKSQTLANFIETYTFFQLRTKRLIAFDKLILICIDWLILGLIVIGQMFQLWLVL